MPVSKNIARSIDNHVDLRDMLNQTYPIYACTGANHARYFITFRYMLRWLEARVFEVTFE